MDELRRCIGSVVVANVVIPAWGFTPPVHHMVNDSRGKSIVIEDVDGKLHVHDNPLGIINDSPSFDWQMPNLRNDLNFTFANPDPVTVGGVKLPAFVMGAGMLGPPGDVTPPSRFVRAAAFSTSAEPGSTGDDAVLNAFHMLSNFDIPKGAAREKHRDEHGNILADHTIWTSANDLVDQRQRPGEQCLLFRTYVDSLIRSVDRIKNWTSTPRRPADSRRRERNGSSR